MKVGNIASRRSPRVDDHDTRPACRSGGGKTLIQHRVTPCHVAADQNHQIGGLDVVVTAGHDILAKGADMTPDRGGHAQARIGVDIAAADKPFHQLVGDIVVLGQELAGDVKGDRVGVIGGNRVREALGDQVERLVPAGGSAADLRMQKAALGCESLAECHTLRAESTAIGRVVGVSTDRPVGGHQHPATNTAIGASGSDGSVCSHAAVLRSSAAAFSSSGAESHIRPSASLTAMRGTRPSSGASASPLSS